MGSRLLSLARHRWYAALVLLSGAVLLATLIAYPVDHAHLRRLLFWLGSTGERTIGAWWSGMLLLLAAALVFDGSRDARKRPAERRGWLVLAAVLLILSFDEVAGVHEPLSDRGLRYVGVAALLGLCLTAYAVIELHRGGASRVLVRRIIWSFVLLATVPVHEAIEHSFDWPNAAIRGVRAVLEEGTEIAAMLMLVAVGAAQAREALRRTPPDALAAATQRRAVLVAGLILLPVLSAAPLVFPFRNAPLHWLGSAVYLCAALRLARAWALEPASGPGAWPGLLLLLAASASATAVSVAWDPALLGTTTNLRGLSVSLVLLAAIPLLATRSAQAVTLLVLGALTAWAAVRWPHHISLWQAVPAVGALLLYALVSTRTESPVMAQAPVSEPAGAGAGLPLGEVLLQAPPPAPRGDDDARGDTVMNARRRSDWSGAVALAGLLLAASHGPFAAEVDRLGGTGRVSATISIKDVDVSSPHGARWLYRKIVSTAKAACWGSVERQQGRGRRLSYT